MTRLYHFNYGSTMAGMSDACLTPIKNLTRLQLLNLDGNRITDDGLAVISRISSLEDLDLKATEVTNAGLVHLRALKNLKTLSLGGTRVTPEGASALQSALPGVTIDFAIDPELDRMIKQSRSDR